MQENILQITYLIASVTFIGGLKYLGNAKTARKGNIIAAIGMILAIFGTIFLFQTKTGEHLHNLGFIFGGLAVGTLLGWIAAKRVQMTAMPEMVSLFNGMGGACAALISIVEFNHLIEASAVQDYYRSNTDLIFYLFPVGKLLIILLGLIIGSVSFAGSMVAWGKLNGKVKDISFKGQNIFNLVILFIIIVGAVVLMINIENGLELTGSRFSKGIEPRYFLVQPWVQQIGRASCRERVSSKV